MAKQQSNKNEVLVTYNGIKSTPGDHDNMPTKEHEFIVAATGHTLRYKTIKLLQYAKPVKGKKYKLGFESNDMSLPLSITVNGTLFLRETNNRIVSIDPEGNKVNHSDNPIFKAIGQFTKENNKKLIAEGKPPIKPIKRRW